jgi:hypothetical protein
MNLIERYVSEIGKRLPRKSRADIETEIRSTLEDMLEERSTQAGRPVDDEMVKELLREYGAPDKVAATYLPEQYLIGPKLFPIFTLVLKIVVTVLTVLALVGFGVRFGMSAMTVAAFGTQLAKSALEYFGGIISAFGNIVLIFAILERVLPKSEYENELQEEGWDPAQLMQEPEPDEVRIWEPIAAIVFTVLALLIFNVYPQFLGMAYSSDQLTLFVPTLSAAFFRMLPWINVTWVLSIGLNLYLLRSGRWTPAARWFEIGLKVAGIGIAYFLLTGPSILAVDTAALAKTSLDPKTAALLVNLMKQAVTLALAIAILAGGIEVVRAVYRLLFKQTPKLRLTQ